MNLLAFMPGPWEMAIVLVVALLLFGTRLPKVMRSLGSSVHEFRKGVEQIEDVDRELRR